LDKLYTCEEVAERYSVKLTTVWDWIRKSTLSAIKVGRSYRVRESDLLEFEQANTTVKES
jgi:excisionase family DNA binding protein